jgi:hypothetical protein
MKRAALLVSLFVGCYYDHHHDDCFYGYGGSCSNGGGSGGAGSGGSSGSGQSSGYCTSNAQCGGNLVCDHASGACASATPGCGQASFTPRHTTGEILLVLDRSNSMRNPTTTGTKWTDLVGSLQQVLTTTSQVKWGLELFPASDEQACTIGSVDIAPADGTTSSILSEIAMRTPTGSGTPTREAVKAASQYLGGRDDGAKKYILLATDGEPNCSVGASDENASDATAAVAAVASASQLGVSTFVIGVSISPESDQTLSQLAQAGGTARTGTIAYFPSSNSHDLEAALEVVARQIALCTFDLDPAPPVGDTIQLSVGGRPFTRNQSHRGDGWDFTNGGKSIALYGAACDAVQAGGNITAQYVCGAGSTCNTSTNQCVPNPTGTGGAGGGGDGGAGGGIGGYGGTGGAGGGTGGAGGGTGGAGGSPGIGDMCHYNAQCGVGGICTDGMCSPPCTSSTQCGTGAVCLSGNCVPNPNPTPQCTFNTDCGANGTCINATCHSNCTTNADCSNPADICDHGICQPNWHRVPSCTSNAQCTGGMACVDGICRTPCWADADCSASSSGPVCHTGYCFTANQANPQCFMSVDCGANHVCVDATCR